MTPKTKKNSLGAALRMLTILRMIPRRGTIGTKGLHSQLQKLGWSVSLRTVQRDLVKLEQVFPDLQCRGRRDIASWFWKQDAEVLDLPAMDVPMALVLMLSRRFLVPMMPPQVLDYLAPYFRAAERVLEADGGNISGTWSERIAIVPRQLPLIPAAIDPQLFEAVAESLMLSPPRVLEATYRNRQGKRLTADFHPLGLVFHQEVVYLVATVWDYDDPRHFALHRFENCRLGDRPARSPEGFDFQAYLAQKTFQYPIGAEPIRLVLRVHEVTARHLQETPLSEDQSIEPIEASEWHRLTATLADTQQLRWWLLGMGPHVVVEEPATLRDAIHDSLTRACRHYR